MAVRTSSQNLRVGLQNGPKTTMNGRSASTDLPTFRPSEKAVIEERRVLRNPTPAPFETHVERRLVGEKEVTQRIPMYAVTETRERVEELPVECHINVRRPKVERIETVRRVEKEFPLIHEKPDPMPQPPVYSDRIVEVPMPITVMKPVYKREVRELVREVPKIVEKVVDRVVEVPDVRYVYKFAQTAEDAGSEFVEEVTTSFTHPGGHPLLPQAGSSPSAPPVPRSSLGRDILVDGPGVVASADPGWNAPPPFPPLAPPPRYPSDVPFYAAPFGPFVHPSYIPFYHPGYPHVEAYYPPTTAWPSPLPPEAFMLEQPIVDIDVPYPIPVPVYVDYPVDVPIENPVPVPVVVGHRCRPVYRKSDEVQNVEVFVPKPRYVPGELPSYLQPPKRGRSRVTGFWSLHDQAFHPAPREGSLEFSEERRGTTPDPPHRDAFRGASYFTAPPPLPYTPSRTATPQRTRPFCRAETPAPRTGIGGYPRRGFLTGLCTSNSAGGPYPLPGWNGG